MEEKHTSSWPLNDCISGIWGVHRFFNKWGTFSGSPKGIAETDRIVAGRFSEESLDEKVLEDVPDADPAPPSSLLVISSEGAEIVKFGLATAWRSVLLVHEWIEAIPMACHSGLQIDWDLA